MEKGLISSPRLSSRSESTIADVESWPASYHADPDRRSRSRHRNILVGILWLLSLLVTAWISSGGYKTSPEFSYEAGFETDMGPLRSMIKVKQVKFTGGIKFAEDGTAYRHVEPGTTQYVGKPSDEIDLAWEELIRGQVVDLIGDEAKDWVNKTTRHHGQWYPVGADVFHQLHCVNMLRRNLNPEYYKPYNPEPLHTEHMYHCLDYLRQGVMCQSDLTPMYFEYSAVRHRTRQVQETWHTCRDFDRIQAWSLARDYDAHLDGPRTHEH